MRLLHLLKTEVFTLGRYLDINKDIINATPTDGLWDEDKSDEEQIGAKYSELEWAMSYNQDRAHTNKQQKKILSIYNKLNSINQHKMNPIPICKIPKNLK